MLLARAGGPCRLGLCCAHRRGGLPAAPVHAQWSAGVVGQHRRGRVGAHALALRRRAALRLRRRRAPRTNANPNPNPNPNPNQDATFETIELELGAADRKMYDDCAAFWQVPSQASRQAALSTMAAYSPWRAGQPRRLLPRRRCSMLSPLYLPISPPYLPHISLPRRRCSSASATPSSSSPMCPAGRRRRTRCRSSGARTSVTVTVILTLADAPNPNPNPNPNPRRAPALLQAAVHGQGQG